MKGLSKKIIKVASAHPEKVVLWFFLFILVAMSLYLIVRWHAKEPPGDLTPAARPLLDAPVLVDFSGLMMEEGSYLQGFPRDPFFHLPLAPDPDHDPVPDPDPDPDPDQEPEPTIIIREPLPQLTEVIIVGDRRVVFIRIGREIHRVTGGEEINGWTVLNVGEESVALRHEKRGEELVLLFRR